MQLTMTSVRIMGLSPVRGQLCRCKVDLDHYKLADHGFQKESQSSVYFK
jgi:hypothetical protein